MKNEKQEIPSVYIISNILEENTADSTTGIAIHITFGNNKVSYVV